jgi:hypothetical protein
MQGFFSVWESFFVGGAAVAGWQSIGAIRWLRPVVSPWIATPPSGGAQ